MADSELESSETRAVSFVASVSPAQNDDRDQKISLTRKNIFFFRWFQVEINGISIYAL